MNFPQITDIPKLFIGLFIGNYIMYNIEPIIGLIIYISALTFYQLKMVVFEYRDQKTLALKAQYGKCKFERFDAIKNLDSIRWNKLLINISKNDPEKANRLIAEEMYKPFY